MLELQREGDKVTRVGIFIRNADGSYDSEDGDIRR